MKSAKASLDDRLFSLELRIMKGDVDDLTATQTFDSLVSESSKSLNPHSYAKWLWEEKYRLEHNVVGELKQIGRLQRKINLFNKIGIKFTENKGGKK